MKRSEGLWGFFFISPILVFLAIFLVMPIIQVFYYSFFDWNPLADELTYIGLKNYIDIFHSEEFYIAIKNNFFFLIMGTILWTIFPLLVAVLINEEIRGWKFFKSTYFLPSVLSTVVIGILFKTFFSYNGPINVILRGIGLDFLAIDWLAQGITSIPIITIIINWAGFGGATLIILAGLANISVSIYEASYLDRASWFQRLFYITMPMLKSTMQFVISLNVVFAFTGLFNYIFVMTNGGPGYESTVIEFLLYQKGFGAKEFGYACALAVIMFTIILAIYFAQKIFFSQKEDLD